MLFAALLIACQTQSETNVFMDESATRLELSSGNGVIEVQPGDALRVERQGAVSAVGFAFEAEVKDGLAILGERCPLAWTCHIDTLVELPPGMPLVLRLGTGELWLSDLSNPLQIDLDAGTVYGSDLVASSLEISSQTANVDLSLDGLSDALILDVGVGDLSVELPAGPYALEVGSGLGEVRLWNVEQAPDAQVDIVMRTGAGDVSLTGTATSEP